MGTRGFVGFVIDGVEKIAYNHWDSYPEGLGIDTLDWLRGAVQSGRDGLVESVRALRVVDPQSSPNEDDIERLRRFADTDVSTGQVDDWYVLLRKTQGDPGLMLEAGVIEDAGNFPCDSLFAEWGYVVDLDSGHLEVYRGLQKEAHDKGRFADRPRQDEKYAPVALVASWPLAELPTDKDFVAAFGVGDDE